ncbi:MAG TPA: ROK family protein [Verrucomicrobiales bacterium]|jgi:fructokinase|nr:ROK family protein [Verrucomicrobiales bacterium]
MPSPLPLIGAIEAGGTKFVLATGTGPDDLRDVERIPTTTPAETLQRCVEYFSAAQKARGPLAALGIGTFGPAGVDPSAPDWGFITTTPKPGWQQTDVAGVLRRALNVPVAFDTDVNAAVYGEWLWGAGQGCNVVLYLTIGTGIGGGVLINGRPLHGLLHPEMGHIRIPRPPALADFAGSCSWHGDCLEGLASGPAMAKRWEVAANTLPPDHPAWEAEAACLASACASFACTLSPQRIILGGGVMDSPGLLGQVQEKTRALLNGYLQHPLITDRVQKYITAPGLSSHAGICGALALGMEAAKREV